MSKKTRNHIIALACLLAFVAVGVLFYANWVVQKPFAIVLFLTDNLTTSTLAASRIYENGADSRLNLERLPHLGLVTTHAADFAVSDPAAAATAVATGIKVNNRSVGVDSAGQPLENLFDLARKAGRATGLITNAAISDTTPAAFYAKSGNPQDSETIAAQLVESANIDVVLGADRRTFSRSISKVDARTGAICCSKCAARATTSPKTSRNWKTHRHGELQGYWVFSLLVTSHLPTKSSPQEGSPTLPEWCAPRFSSSNTIARVICW